LIKDEIDHKTVNFTVITSGGLSEFSRATYVFMIVLNESFSSESSKYLAMI